MHTYHIHIQGQVQGVGFRPYVWRLAQQHALLGWVNNAADGLHIRVNANETTLQHFLKDLQQGAPKISHILNCTAKVIASESFDAFSILQSDTAATPNLMLSPDFALCHDCRQEMYDSTNRRYQYPFITCTLCGPRFSIIQQLPYDRNRTTMQRFAMCKTCLAEYLNPTDRRYYAQTNSCPECGISLKLLGHEYHSNQQAIADAVVRIQDGQILAVKGLGGFLLMCDATSAEAIRKLRLRKNRPSKPLAVLYPNAAMLAGDVALQADDLALLEGAAAPILLLPLLPEPASGICTTLLAPYLDRLGVMLPYAPLLDWLARQSGKPLVATSGNASGAPVCYTDEQASQQLAGIADAVLTHNRDIVFPQDDSVVQHALYSRQPILVRRSRGYAPSFFEKAAPDQPGILAVGAELKSTFAWQHLGNTYVSPYLGDLDSFDTQERFEQVLHQFISLMQARPQRLVADKHPGYFSTQLAERLAVEWQAPLQKVQHHEAHFAAVLGENQLLEEAEPVLGVIWDGTGLGNDGQIWGGEFFVSENGLLTRARHIEYFDWLLGDKMAREPRLSALSCCFGLKGAEERLSAKFTTSEWNLYQKMLETGAPLRTSSMGRLFDAVAALLGLSDKVSFEGEAAMRLEALARRYFNKHGLPETLSNPAFPQINPLTGTSIAIKPVFQNLLDGLQKGEHPESVAARWHLILVQMIENVALMLDIRSIAFSGGVFQNGVLIDLLNHYLKPRFKLYFHHQISPNDECISYGQLAAARRVLGAD